MTKPNVFTDPRELQLKLAQISGDQSIGFVPTMGALHRGHFELLKRARSENQIVILSIFVNSTQFNDPNDFKKYPSTWDEDLAMAQKAEVDYILRPTFAEMYPDDYRYRMSENKMSRDLCGHSRPGHFDGVLTVVLKLIHIVSPQKVYFGEKDRQQMILIEGMIQALFLKCKLVSVSTVREADGLAMSSRNSRLSEAERKIAPEFFKILSNAPNPDQAIQSLTEKGFRVDYIEDRKIDRKEIYRFGAAYLGEVRLIDNVKIK